MIKRKLKIKLNKPPDMTSSLKKDLIKFQVSYKCVYFN